MGKRSIKSAMISEMRHPDLDILANVDHPKHREELIHAYNYANFTFDTTQLKGFVNDFIEDYSVQCIPDWELQGLGAVCWVITNGGDIGKDVSIVKDRVKRLYDEYNTKSEQVIHKRSKTPQEVNTETLIGELEGLLDDALYNRDAVVDPITLYQKASPFKKDDIINHFSRYVADIDNNPEDYPHDNINKVVKGIIGIIIAQIDDYDKLQDTKKTKKVVRQAKQKKIVPTKMVKKLKYKKVDDDFKIKSVQPSKIVTADCLWVFNTKTKKMSQYVAADKVGLLVSGSTIKNFDPDKSVEKTLRKPEEFIKELNKAGKVEQRGLLEKIRAVSKCPKGRINEHCILVKVY